MPIELTTTIIGDGCYALSKTLPTYNLVRLRFSEFHYEPNYPRETDPKPIIIAKTIYATQQDYDEGAAYLSDLLKKLSLSMRTSFTWSFAVAQLAPVEPAEPVPLVMPKIPVTIALGLAALAFTLLK